MVSVVEVDQNPRINFKKERLEKVHPVFCTKKLTLDIFSFLNCKLTNLALSSLELMSSLKSFFIKISSFSQSFTIKPASILMIN